MRVHVLEKCSGSVCVIQVKDRETENEMEQEHKSGVKER